MRWFLLVLECGEQAGFDNGLAHNVGEKRHHGRRRLLSRPRKPELQSQAPMTSPFRKWQFLRMLSKIVQINWPKIDRCESMADSIALQCYKLLFEKAGLK